MIVQESTQEEDHQAVEREEHSAANLVTESNPLEQAEDDDEVAVAAPSSIDSQLVDNVVEEVSQAAEEDLQKEDTAEPEKAPEEEQEVEEEEDIFEASDEL